MMDGAKEPEGGASLMEKPRQEPLKCPRCESTNTKFCYYNNYSLSQPRHFCKACKRYWTRGGTLRSVPVGGGCRKNKRIRRIIHNNNPNSSSNNSSSNIALSDSNTFNQQNPSSGGGGHLVSSLIYGLPSNLVPSIEANGFQFSSSYDNLGGINGLGFPSSSSSHHLHGSKNHNATSCTTTSLPAMSIPPLITSASLENHKQKCNFETLFPYDLDLQIKGVSSNGSYHEESVKVDGYEDQIHDHDHHHQHQQPMGESDPSIFWNIHNYNSDWASNGVNWLDPNYSSLGSSSVPSLI